MKNVEMRYAITITTPEYSYEYISSNGYDWVTMKADDALLFESKSDAEAVMEEIKEEEIYDYLEVVEVEVEVDVDLLDILMENGCTRNSAERLMTNGTIIRTEQEYLNEYDDILLAGFGNKSVEELSEYELNEYNELKQTLDRIYKDKSGTGNGFEWMYFHNNYYFVELSL